MTNGLVVCLIVLFGRLPAAQANSDSRAPDSPSKVFSRVLPEAKKGGLPVLLPSELPYYVDPRRIHDVSVESKEGAYSISLHSSFGCADECFVGSFSAVRGNAIESAGRRKIDLAKGIAGYYSYSPCGAKCPPAQIAWVYNSVSYTVRFAPDEGGPEDTESALVKLANSCIEGGPR